MKTTPGPWWELGGLVHAADSMICEVSEPHGYDHIAHKRLQLGSKDWDEAIGNAYLIAAAPDLLFAAKQALMALEEGYDAPIIREHLRDAIMKAEEPFTPAPVASRFREVAAAGEDNRR